MKRNKVKNVTRTASPSVMGRQKSRTTDWIGPILVILFGAGFTIALVIFLTPADRIPELMTAESTVSSAKASDKDSSPIANQPVPFPEADDDGKVDGLQFELLAMADFLALEFENSVESLHVAAMIFAELNQTKKAEDTWRKCTDLKPKDLGPYIGLATVLSQRGEYAQSVQLLENVQESGQKSVELFAELVSGLSKLGELDRADAVLKDGFVAFPNDASLIIQRGMIDTQFRRFETAEKAFRRAIELGDNSKSTQFMLANVLARLGKAAEAQQVRADIENRDKIAKQGDSTTFEESYLRTLRGLAVRFFKMGSQIALANGKPLQAERWLLRTMAIEPSDLSTFMELSTVYRRSNRMEEALEVQKRLLELQPQNVLNYINLASVASHLGKYELAERVLVDAIKTNPEIAFPYAELARIHLAKREFSIARERITKAQNLEPRNVEWHLMSAMIAEALGDATCAIECLRRAQEIAPNDPRLLSLPKAAQVGK